MQFETCQIGRTLRLGDNTQIVIHRRQGDRIVLGAKARVGTVLILGGATVGPIAGTLGVWSYLFSLQAVRQFTLGRYAIRVWLPGEVISHAADCDDWVHVGIETLDEPVMASVHQRFDTHSLPAPFAPAPPLSQTVGDGGWPLCRGTE